MRQYGEAGVRLAFVLNQALGLLIRQHRAVSGATEINQPTTQATKKYYADCIEGTETNISLMIKGRK